MFDLNVNLIYSDSACDQDKTTTAAMEAKIPEVSGTSNSSVVSAEEALNNGGEEDSNTSSAFTFDILKTVGDQNQVTGDKIPVPEIVTRELFPVTSDRIGTAWEFLPGQPPSFAARPQWLNLSVSDSRGSSEVRNVQQKQPPRKSRRGPRSRSSQYRGVTFYRRTGRWESHIWDCGKQVYLGGFDTAHAAARAYDRAAIKFRGVDADINFNISDYDEDMKQVRHMSKEEFVRILRRQSTGFARGSSRYRGVMLHKCGHWEGRMGQLLGKKAYDKAAIKCNGRETVTNFEPCIYERDMILNTNNGGSGHNLDLKLGISTPSVKRNGAVGDCQFDFAACDLLARKRPRVEGPASAAALGGQTFHNMMMIGKQPSVSASLEERAKEKVEAISLPRFSNWAWQVHGDEPPTPMPSLFSTAASSGFSSSSATTPPLPLISSHYKTSHDVCLPASSTSTANTSFHCYNHKMLKPKP